MDNGQVWNSERYDNKLGFVSEYGKDVLHLLKVQSGERVLDLGCGTGDLSAQIGQSGAEVTGMDLSPEMIEQAKVKYPHISFVVGNGEQFQFPAAFDRIFSNAALHWMKNAGAVLDCVSRNLKLHGQFVAEFGGKGNIEQIYQAICDVLQQHYSMDASELNPWYFPSIGQYSSLLEQKGFRVLFAQHFDRPTTMSDGEHGINIWLDSFAQPFFAAFSVADKEHAYTLIAQKLKERLFYDGAWQLDYKRLRVAAIKERE